MVKVQQVEWGPLHRPQISIAPRPRSFKGNKETVTR